MSRKKKRKIERRSPNKDTLELNMFQVLRDGRFPLITEMAKGIKAAAAPAPAPKKSKLPEPKVKYEKMSCKVDDPKLYAKFPELKALVTRLRKEGYDNFYVQMSFTVAGVTNPKTGRIPIFMGLAGA